MPANFTEEKRQEIREALLAAGYDLIRKVGLKRMKVSMIAERAGIAAGTFYHFFASKEAFVAALIDEQDRRMAEKLAGLQNPSGKLSPEQMVSWLRESFRPENNFLMELKTEDWIWLKTHQTKPGLFGPAHDEQEAKRYLSCVDGIRPDLDLRVLINFIKTIYSMAENRDTFFQEVFETNVDLIFDCICRYAVQREED